MRQFVLFLFIAIMAAMPLQAASVTASALLTQTYANQIESWLGEGPITLTRIFYKQTGDGLNSNNFHNAVDGQGRTITVMSVSNYSNQIIGGYNPINWDTHNHYHMASNTNAFLFNLTNTMLFRKNNTTWTHETYNNASYGPTFGAGHDLYVDSSLQSGYTYGNYSYGSGNGSSSNPLVSGAWGNNTYYSTLEVFTITTPDFCQ